MPEFCYQTLLFLGTGSPGRTRLPAIPSWRRPAYDLAATETDPARCPAIVTDMDAAQTERSLRRLPATPSMRFRLVCGPETPYLAKPRRVISLSARGPSS